VGSHAFIFLASFVLVSVTVFCIARARRSPGQSGIRSSLELTPQDGWSLLNLAVVNHHDTKVWVERAVLTLTELNANMPSGPASGSGAVEIREFIRSGESLCVSLIEAVYNAAGKPQGAYSFLIRCTTRYRLGEEWLESESPVFKVEMVRLSGTRVRRIAAKGQAARGGAVTENAQPLFHANKAPRAEELIAQAPENADVSLPS